MNNHTQLLALAYLHDVKHLMSNAEFYIRDNIKSNEVIKAKEFIELATSTLEREQLNDWVSVNEYLPAEQGAYLVCYLQDFYDGSSYKKMDIVHFYPSTNTFEFYHPRITHWMPLPSNPENKTNE